LPYDLEFYAEPGGRQPVRTFLDTLEGFKREEVFSSGYPIPIHYVV
jgi:hypothetical protein